MIQRFAALDPQGAADEITKEYIEVCLLYTSDAADE